jgi:hypothetical protein
MLHRNVVAGTAADLEQDLAELCEDRVGLEQASAEAEQSAVDLEHVAGEMKQSLAEPNQSLAELEQSLAELKRSWGNVNQRSADLYRELPKLFDDAGSTTARAPDLFRGWRYLYTVSANSDLDSPEQVQGSADRNWDPADLNLRGADPLHAVEALYFRLGAPDPGLDRPVRALDGPGQTTAGAVPRWGEPGRPQTGSGFSFTNFLTGPILGSGRQVYIAGATDPALGGLIPQPLAAFPGHDDLTIARAARGAVEGRSGKAGCRDRRRDA